MKTGGALTWYEIPQCKGYPEVARWIENKVAEWPGVKDAKCRSSTGRLRIEWSADAFDGAGAASAETFDPDELLSLFSLREAYSAKEGRAKGSGQSELEAWRGPVLAKVLESLGADSGRGLNTAEIPERLRSFGFNTIPPVDARKVSEILAEQFRNPSTALLMASAAASLLTGGALEAGVIAGIVLMNAAIGFSTDANSERAIKKLSAYGPREAWVIRSGVTQCIRINEIVPGDLIELNPGMTVPADARLTEAAGLSADESLLTGESVPVSKSASQRPGPGAPLSESVNMVFKGSTVATGSGRAIVVATGMSSQAGRIQSMLGDRFRAPTRLQVKLDDLNRELALLSVAAGAFVFLAGVMRGHSVLQLARTAISVAVAAIPEGLPTISTFALSKAVTKMLEEKILIRDLRAIEVLGSVQTLCLDKTGTLTQNKMEVAAVAVPWRPKPRAATEVLARKHRSLRALMACALLCNDASRAEDQAVGSPTEQALLDFAGAYGLRNEDLRNEFHRTETAYRTEDLPYMITTHLDRKQGCYRMLKGNPLEVLALCSFVRTKDRSRRPISKVDRKIASAQNEEMSMSAYRVLGFAYQAPGSEGWTWLGLIGLVDPPRDGVRAALARFHRAGVRTVMITGDQAPTARAIAADLGMSNGEDLIVIDFNELKKKNISAREMASLAASAHVFARVAPEQKRELVETIRSSGRVVAMVGDGINDAPALKAANLGIALGKAGAEVAKEVAGVVMLDDRFDRLLRAVEQGRATNDSLRKAVRFLVSSNLSEMAVVLLETAIGLPSTLETLQLMWLNLVTDTFPALALAMDPPRRDVMEEPPSDPEEPLLGQARTQKMIADAVASGGSVLGALIWGHLKGRSKVENQTTAVNTMILGQVLYSFSLQGPERVRWREVLKSHRALAAVGGGTLALHGAFVSSAKLRRFIGMGPTRTADQIVSALAATFGFAVIESRKSEPARGSRQ